MRWALPLAYCLVGGPAFAQAGVRWQYVAPPECPSEQQFRDQVQSRLLGDHETEAAPSEGSAERLRVEVRVEPSQRRASLSFQEPGAPVVERTVEGDSCDELVSGLALITALAFGAARAPASAAPRAADSGAASPPRSEAPVEPRPAEPSPAGTSARDSGTAGTRPSNSIAVSAEIGAGGWWNSWLAPGGGLGGDAFIRLAPKGQAAWSVRAAGLYGFGASSVGERRAEFRLLGGRVEGCPASLRMGKKVAGEACLALDLGALSGRGDAASALLEATSQTVFWGALALVGRVRAHLGGPFSVEGQGELGVPLVHHEFMFQAPSERIFLTPAVGFGARIALGAKFL